MTNFVKVDIIPASADESAIMMANLSEHDFYAFEDDANILTAYIKEEDFNEEKLKYLLPESAHFESSVIGGKNWNEEWEKGFQPVIIDDFVGIRASFHDPLPGVKHEIIITPKMSFGTGHHETTHLMLEQMGKISFKNKSVLDFGTGTGILAILAEKLGAASVTAIDNDDWSIRNAAENIAANGCEAINLEKRDNITGLSSVNIILANINYRVLIENAECLSMLLKAGSLLVISGFLSKDEESVTGVFVKYNFIKKAGDQKNDWAAIVLLKY